MFRMSIADFTVRSPARLTLGVFVLAITVFTSLLVKAFFLFSWRGHTAA